MSYALCRTGWASSGGSGSQQHNKSFISLIQKQKMDGEKRKSVVINNECVMYFNYQFETT